MMRIEDDGDIDISAGLRFATESLSGVKQSVRARLQLNKGEYALDLDAGTPYTDEILGLKPTERRLREIFSGRILATPGIDELISLEIEQTRRSLTVTWRARVGDDIIADEVSF